MLSATWKVQKVSAFGSLLSHYLKLPKRIFSSKALNRFELCIPSTYCFISIFTLNSVFFIYWRALTTKKSLLTVDGFAAFFLHMKLKIKLITRPVLACNRFAYLERLYVKFL